jgi:riboflavin kinase/FMN adenylyltransferase
VTVQYAHRVYKGMLYIGNRPTIDGLKRNIEVNLFDFDQDIYGESVTIFIQKWIRGDMKFKGLEELQEQLGKDKQDALKMLRV